jgi:hypothetical protein
MREVLGWHWTKLGHFPASGSLAKQTSPRLASQIRSKGWPSASAERLERDVQERVSARR